ncbi:hypothetical protein ACFQ0P_13335 [Microbacterium insulae]|uniref:Uncharacterized protein n=1 Tax=Microbacterium insulae TaxID=483014 RepID=A0ABW3AM28_9MICO
MTTPEQPANPPLTRKQMREIRNTGSTPVITPEEMADAAAGVGEVDDSSAPIASAPAAATAHESVPTAVAVAPLPRPAEPVAVPPAPGPDSAVDLGASPLTRRQARQQERIRTASVPVITPEVAAAHTASMTTPPAQAPAEAREEAPTTGVMHDLFGLATSSTPVTTAPRAVDAPVVDAPVVDAPFSQGAPDAAEATDEANADVTESVWPTDAPDARDDESDEKPKERVVNPMLGAGLLAGEPEQADLPPSFDQLLARSTGAVSVPNALILSQAPEVAPISGALSATGEVLITGTLNLPEGLGSTGHALGTADGKEVDATLIDGELPAHSSPTPIAASAAISTVKSAGDVIKPPAPEKGSKLVLALAIMAGALGLVLVGLLVAIVVGAL